jgi:hypothetical protein
VVVSSRTGYSQDTLQEFDSVFTVCDFEQGQQEELIKKFALQTGLSHTRLSQLNAVATNEVCRTPLLLTALCAIAKCSAADEELPQNRTDIYKRLHQMIVEKASHRMKCMPQDIEQSVVAAIAQVAFKMWKEDRDDLIEEEIISAQFTMDDLLQVGYITRESYAHSLRFIHRTFLEFLSVLHLRKLEAD